MMFGSSPLYRGGLVNAEVERREFNERMDEQGNESHSYPSVEAL